MTAPTDLVQSARARMHAACGWVVTKRLAWLAIGVLVGAWGLSGAFTEKQDDQIRWAGGILQVAGLCVVALGIEQTRTQFGRPSIRQLIRGRIETLLGIKRRATVVFEIPSIEVAIEANPPRLVVGARPSHTLEQRVAILEGAVDQVRQELDSETERQTQALKDIRLAIQQEQRARLQVAEALQRELETAVAGGIRVEIVGLIWLLFGIVFATIPGEISSVLPGR